MTNALDEIVEELRAADREERIELLLDYARRLPELPPRLAALRDAGHRVEECQSPVYLFVEAVDNRPRLYADAPMEAPSVRGFVALLLEGLRDASFEQIMTLPNDLVQQAGLVEILGLLRVKGLSGVLHRLKREAARVAAEAGVAANTVATAR